MELGDYDKLRLHKNMNANLWAHDIVLMRRHDHRLPVRVQNAVTPLEWYLDMTLNFDDSVCLYTTCTVTAEIIMIIVGLSN